MLETAVGALVGKLAMPQATYTPVADCPLSDRHALKAVGSSTKFRICSWHKVQRLATTLFLVP